MPKPVSDPVAGVDEIMWDTIQTGLGTEHDFARDPAMIGYFVGSGSTEVPDSNSDIPGATRTATYFQFHPYGTDDPNEIVFVWGSAQIDDAFGSDLIRVGDLVRIKYLGIKQFTGKRGPQQIKEFRVQAQNRQQADAQRT